jgi:hypothetical protein
MPWTSPHQWAASNLLEFLLGVSNLGIPSPRQPIKECIHMPLRTNVGVNRKVVDNNYGSRGASVNLEVELDSSLTQELERLQERIRQVFRLAQQSVTEELARQTTGNDGSNGHTAVAKGNGNGNRRQNGNGITRALPQLRTLQQMVVEVHRLFDRRCRMDTALAKLAKLRIRVRRFQAVGKTLSKLFSPNPKKTLTFLDDKLMPATSNTPWQCHLPRCRLYRLRNSQRSAGRKWWSKLPGAASTAGLPESAVGRVNRRRHAIRRAGYGRLAYPTVLSQLATGQARRGIRAPRVVAALSGVPLRQPSPSATLCNS